MAQPVSLLLLGEADVGKSSLIQRFSNPSHQVRDEGASLPVRHFWSMSPPSSASLETTVDGLPVSVSIDEVPASRGRSSNISQIATRSRTADCVLFCFSLDKEWSARSLNTYLNVMNRARTPQQIPQRGVRLQRSRAQQAPAPSPAEPAPARVLPPVVLVQLKSEKNPTSEIGDAMAREHGFPLIKVSVKDNLNVTEVLELAVRSALHKRTPAPAPASAPALPKEVEISEAPAPVVEVAAVPAEKVSMKKRKKQADDQLRRKSARLAQEQQSAEDTAQDDKPDVAQSA